MEARRQLDPVDNLISEAKWDAIRNIIKTYPLGDMRVSKENGCTSVQLLDQFSKGEVGFGYAYSPVFQMADNTLCCLQSIPEVPSSSSHLFCGRYLMHPGARGTANSMEIRGALACDSPP